MYQNVYQGYVDNEILNADPMRLIVLMYRGALDAVSAARGALASGDIRVRSAKITKAIDILNELALSLDHSKAPDLCRNLVELYDYMNRRLIEGNNQQTDAPLSEVERLLGDLLGAWQQAAAAESTVSAGPAVPAYQVDAPAAYERFSYAY